MSTDTDDTTAGAQTRAEHHADSPAHEVRRARGTIARLLDGRRSREAAISSAQLADRVDLSASTVRDIVADIRDCEELPVANCAGGYYVISTAEQFNREMKRIDDEIQTKEERKRCIAAAFGGQE